MTSQTIAQALPEAELEEKIREMIAQQPQVMTPSLARHLGVPEVEVIRRLPGEAAVELDIGQWEAIIRSFEVLGKVHVICNNGVAVLESFGTFGNFSTWGEYFNVQTKIDMHIRFAELASVWAVEKPSHTDGKRTLSFQFFSASGNSAFKVFLSFGGKAPSADREAQFDVIRTTYRRRPASA